MKQLFTTIPVLPDSAPFSVDQRMWLNGYLAGYFSRITVAPAAEPAAERPSEPLLIMFGSQTGSAEGLAKRIARESSRRGFAPQVFPLNDYKRAALAESRRLLVVSSTWGDGDPPDNASEFWSWISSDSAPRLETLQFAVLGLGDRNYSDFCGASRKIDARLDALGGRRLVGRAECDVDYEAPAAAWLDGLWNTLAGAVPAAAEASPAAEKITVTANGNHGQVPQKVSEFGKTNPFPGRLLRNAPLNKPGSTRDVRHYEISLDNSGMDYEAGDVLGVIPVNCPELVREFLTALHCSPDLRVHVANAELPLWEALTRHFDITRPSSELIAAIARHAPETRLSSLLEPARTTELKQWLAGRDIVDLLNLCSTPIQISELVALLRKLTPRLYSIASSHKMHPQEVHLTVSTVRYESHGRPRKGVASTFLAERAASTGVVNVYVQGSHGFKLPSNKDTPIIMVGPGTGIAPFRAFLEDREAVGARGKNWLFFGGQRRDSDFLYEGQLTSWQLSGHLSKLDLAFSRDQADKIYVQHRMLENADELWSWLDSGSHFYVCGDAARMAKDVDATLHAVVQKSGGKTPEQAKSFVAKLKSEKRYQRDVY